MAGTLTPNSSASVFWVSHAVSSPYEPGSTFKAITACAALEEGVLKPGATVFCPGSYSYVHQKYG